MYGESETTKHVSQCWDISTVAPNEIGAFLWNNSIMHETRRWNVVSKMIHTDWFFSAHHQDHRFFEKIRKDSVPWTWNHHNKKCVQFFKHVSLAFVTKQKPVLKITSKVQAPLWPLSRSNTRLNYTEVFLFLQAAAIGQVRFAGWKGSAKIFQQASN